MIKYNYNERLIEKLNIFPFIEKYNFNNEKYNTAIFCALSSIYNHKANYDHIESKLILLGDYYSFEYYSILKDELENSEKWTDDFYFSVFKKENDEIIGTACAFEVEKSKKIWGIGYSIKLTEWNRGYGTAHRHRS